MVRPVALDGLRMAQDVGGCQGFLEMGRAGLSPEVRSSILGENGGPREQTVTVMG